MISFLTESRFPIKRNCDFHTPDRWWISPRIIHKFLTVLSITTIGTCYEYPVQSGIIAGGGFTKYGALMDNLFMWLFTIPFAFLSAFVFNFSPVVTFCFLKVDQILKCIPNCITCNRYQWVRILTEEG